MKSMEKNYLRYRDRVEQIATHDNTKIADLKAKLEKINKYIEDTMKTL